MTFSNDKSHSETRVRYGEQKRDRCERFTYWHGVRVTEKTRRALTDLAATRGQTCRAMFATMVNDFLEQNGYPRGADERILRGPGHRLCRVGRPTTVGH